ncbi:MAG TPA: glycosyltransferase family 4 protein [Thermoplasmata archaeon]|nr:glycosyltransferase family 4 protein [Thermoplasmata archaeon]
MRVAQLTTRYPPGPGGVERHVAELAPRLAARGHAIDVFTSDLYREFPWQRLGPEVPRVETTGFGTVHRLPVWSMPGELHYTFFRGLERALERANPEIVHAHTYGTNQVAVARRHRRRHGTPFVLTAHFHPIWSIEGGWLRHRIRGFYDRRLAGPVVQSAARIVVQTREEERLLRSLRLPLPPLEIIPPGYTPLPPAPAGSTVARDRWGIPGPFVLFVGRLASNKGLLELADAFAPLARRDPAAHLLLVGEDGGMAARVDARVRELGVAPQVHRVGHVGSDADLSALYREARCTVLPSEYEAFGLVLLESLSQGTPVVASRVGGIPEFIEDGRSGFLVPPGDRAALGAAIGRLWDDPASARALGAFGQREVVPRFDWDAIAGRIDRLYAEVVSG